MSVGSVKSWSGIMTGTRIVSVGAVLCYEITRCFVTLAHSIFQKCRHTLRINSSKAGHDFLCPVYDVISCGAWHC